MRGGKRAGAGRPKGAARKVVTVTLSFEQYAWLKANGGSKWVRALIAKAMP